MKARVMPDDRVSLPAELRRKRGLAQRGEVRWVAFGPSVGGEIRKTATDRVRN